MNEGLSHSTHWKLEKRRIGEELPYAIEEWDGNLSLNEGLNHVATLMCGGAGQAFDSAHTHIGIGDSTTAAAATQTGLQAATNKYWQVMDSGYPIYGTSQQIVFKVTVADGDAEYAWNEFVVGNTNDDSGEVLLRKVESKGTKTTGEEWSLTVTYTLS
jgi:hypothetical protein